MARVLDRLEQLSFAQLVELAQDRTPTRFPANGSFVVSRRGGSAYWYYQGYDRSPTGAVGIKTRIYVGPVGDPDTEALRADHSVDRRRFRERRRIASSLRRSGLPAPLRFDGAVLDALQKAGVFQAGAVLVGSMAYQTFSGLIGVRLDGNLMQTGDIDIAQQAGLMMHVAPAVDTNRLQDLLARVDPSFGPIFDRANPGHHLGYINAAAYKVEFLTTQRRRTGEGAVTLKGIDGVSAQPIPYLEFLLEDPVRSIVLHDDGVPVTVPNPARYAVHKLIVSVMRERAIEADGRAATGMSKTRKDVAQAGNLIAALQATGSGHDVGLAWENAWNRGPKWREHLRRGTAKLAAADHALLEDSVKATCGPNMWPSR